MRLIDADALEKDLIDKGFYPAVVKFAIKNAPTIDTVDRELYNQVAWERDVVIKQLNSIGKTLGEKMDDVTPTK